MLVFTTNTYNKVARRSEYCFYELLKTMLFLYRQIELNAVGEIKNQGEGTVK
jgi:hypothetical protein